MPTLGQLSTGFRTVARPRFEVPTVGYGPVRDFGEPQLFTQPGVYLGLARPGLLGVSRVWTRLREESHRAT